MYFLNICFKSINNITCFNYSFIAMLHNLRIRINKCFLKFSNISYYIYLIFNPDEYFVIIIDAYILLMKQRVYKI